MSLAYARVFETTGRLIQPDPARESGMTTRIEVQAPPQPPPSQLSRGGFGLPPEQLEQARARLSRFALVVFTVVAVMSTVTVFAWWGGGPQHVDVMRVLVAITLILAGSLFVVARTPRLDHTTVLKLGLGYEIVQCLASSIGEAWFVRAELGVLQPSPWVLLMIVAYPLIIPSPPRLTAVVALLSAATAPLGFAVVATFGGYEIGLVDYADGAIYPLVAAVIATFGSRVVHGINVDVAEARRMGSYELTEPLGQGGMGQVWKAKHQMLSRPAAVKLIRPEALDTDQDKARELMTRFQDEAQATAALRSAHTVEVYDFGISRDGSFYYVMELLDGIDMDQLVETYGPLSANRVIYLLEQVCHSLHEAHLAGLVHRDIKPANVFVCRHGAELDFVKVLDFGLVRAVRTSMDELEQSLTQEGALLGTPAFMPPEMVLGEGELDGRADIYALGCVAYWLLTGTLVFAAKTPLEAVVMHAKEPPEPPSARTELAIPEALERLVLSCLAKRPEDRPASAEALRHQLTDVPLQSAWTESDAKRWWDTHRPRRTS
jgi:serine/threonine-protein kinase